MTIACAETAERQSVLPKEVVARGVVVVLHHEANQSQVRTMDSEVKGAVPPWVKAVVVHVMGFLFVVVYRNTVDLHPHLRVHNGGGLVIFWFRELLG